MINTPPIALMLGNGSTVLTHAALRHAVDELRTDDGQELEPYHVHKSQPGEGVRSYGRDLGRAQRPVHLGGRAERYETVAARVVADRGADGAGGRVLADLPLLRNPVARELVIRSAQSRVASGLTGRYRMSKRYGPDHGQEESGADWRA
ncbi:MAG: hypothetical protein G8237_07000 [Magnetococcales bacterium]|nr:hypothetical protein [Magnetococcales bacterium]NGZ06089.1 hypothetical protein [Magnetococcales bacterium]